MRYKIYTPISCEEEEIYVDQKFFELYLINREDKNKAIPTAATKDCRKLRKCHNMAKLSSSQWFWFLYVRRLGLLQFGPVHLRPVRLSSVQFDLFHFRCNLKDMNNCLILDLVSHMVFGFVPSSVRWGRWAEPRGTEPYGMANNRKHAATRALTACWLIVVHKSWKTCMRQKYSSKQASRGALVSQRW